MKRLKYMLTLILFIAFFITVNADSFSYGKKIRGKIMDDFKEEQYKNIYDDENILLQDNVNFFDTQNKIMIFENIKEKNLEKQEEITSERDLVLDRIDNIKQTIETVDKDIEQVQDEIVAISKNIYSLQTEISDIKEEVVLKSREITENKEVLLEYIAHIYKKQNLLFGENSGDIDSLKTVLLSNGNLGDILSNLHFSSILEITGQKLMENHRKLIKEMFVKKLDYEQKSEELKEAKSEELTKSKFLIEKKEFREKILAYSEGKKEDLDVIIEEKVETNRELKIKIIQSRVKLKAQKEELLSKYNCDYISEDLLNQEIYLVEDIEDGENSGTGEIEDNNFNCVKLNKILTAESKLELLEDDELTNLFAWPVDPKNGLSAYYKDPDYFDEIGSTHEAIDIIVDQGTDIKAPLDGYITYVRNPEDESYAYVVLKHANGFVTVYGHVSEVLYNEYDFIEVGTVFARTGGELGTYGAGFITSGPHLHFEVFKDKEYKDPLNYLDLTQLGDDKVPKLQKYVYKYYEDYFRKYGVEYKGELDDVIVFKLEGETEIDRQKDLLSKYATKDFNNWDMWVEESIDGGIDPSFTMCIGLAESGLGRRLKTDYNVGNVGNTDSGGERDFQNARSGVYRIVRTLNNEFLGEYDDMAKLSRYGNKDGAIYASSPLHWQNNIIKCLQELKQEHIPDDFHFRVENLEEE